MSFFKDLDLYKGVILASLILLPGAGWMIHKRQQQIDAAQVKLRAAKREGGHLTEIGEMIQQIQTVENNRITGSGAGQYSVYFEDQVLAADRTKTFKSSDITISQAKQRNGVTGSKQRANDFAVTIDFKTDFKATWEFLFAVLYNCESGARLAGQESQQSMASIWKLSKLDIRNASFEEVRNGATPPLPFQDAWIVRKNGLEFARREPKL